ncbi:hypothetical protein E3A20_25830 [Planctomyces bekefii]|uniref:ABC-2 type transporter domain-containing protein n=1 Tax=Planctomyces bekefii TaxID=1653850 RepID=A0A5C6M1Z5_9PLAN|nr:hypothetical protein E3A20_25830 [Planctomyces bekefii]
MVAFWAENVWSLNVMLMFAIRLLGGALLPLTLFPSWAQEYLSYTPFPYLVSFPIRALMGQVSADEWMGGMGILAMWTVFTVALGALIWRRGQLRYTGVGI